MSLEPGLILAITIVASGGVGLAGFAVWLRNRGIKPGQQIRRRSWHISLAHSVVRADVERWSYTESFCEL